jgi:hypothetical protein
MRELEQLRSKPELTVATLLGLIYAHKQHKTPGKDLDLISKISTYFLCIPDREAIGEFEAKVKELRKQVDDMVFCFNTDILLDQFFRLYFMLLIRYASLVNRIKRQNISIDQQSKIQPMF